MLSYLCLHLIKLRKSGRKSSFNPNEREGKIKNERKILEPSPLLILTPPLPPPLLAAVLSRRRLVDVGRRAVRDAVRPPALLLPRHARHVHRHPDQAAEAEGDSQQESEGDLGRGKSGGELGLMPGNIYIHKHK